MSTTIALQTKGYAAPAAKARLEPFSFERRQPGPHDVVIDIKFCGICHSDIHQARDEWGGSRFPLVPGHEIAGIVAHAGDAVTAFKAGDRVGVGCFVDSCGTCSSCKAGLEQFCLVHTAFTYNSTEMDEKTPTYGGYSNRIVVRDGYVLSIPDALPLDASAPLLCAGITLYSPLKHWQAGPGKKIAIVGLGGLGHMGVKLAHALGAEVTVLSQTLRKKDDATRMGADHFYATSDRETFAKLAKSFDLIINTVSEVTNWNQLAGLLKVDGTLVILGIPEQKVPLGAAPLVQGRRSISGSMIGGIAETQEMLDFCGKHSITPNIELIGFDYVNEAYDRVLESDVRYRFVLDVATLA